MESSRRSFDFRSYVLTSSTRHAFSDSSATALHNRGPTTQEAQELRTLIGTETRNHQAYESIFRALLNSTEFIFNH